MKALLLGRYYIKLCFVVAVPPKKKKRAALHKLRKRARGGNTEVGAIV
jgi:hypothetical protein